MKILILHATAGAGHKKAAEAVFNGIKARTNYDARLVDALDYTNPVFQRMYSRSYVFLVTHLPAVWGFFFALTDQPWLQPAVRLARRLYNGLNAQALERMIVEEKADVIVTTHFLSAEVCGRLKTSGRIASKILCVVTDFDAHRIWVNPGVDLFAVACGFTKDKLVRLGIAPDRITITGIPTDTKFSKMFDRAALKQQLKLKPDLFTVLIATGSFGFGPIKQLIELLEGFQLVVVCGHNKELYRQLTDKSSGIVHVKGLVDNMDELMAAADCMITKPGGLSISEALVRQLPLIFFSAIPGQEINNVKVLQSYDVAGGVCSLPEIVTAVQQLAAHPDRLAEIRAKTAALAKPLAVENIIAVVAQA